MNTSDKLPDAPAKSVPVRQRVLSAERLGELISAFLELREGETQRETAHWLGISPALLSQLKAGQKREAGRAAPIEKIDAATADALYKGIFKLRNELRASMSAREARAVVDRLLGIYADAVQPSVASERLAAYEEWCAERATRFFRRRGDRWRISEQGEPERISGSVPLPADQTFVAWSVDANQDTLERWVEVDRKNAAIMLWRVLLPSRSKAGERELKRLEKACEGLPEMRHRVALMRVLEPLLESAETGYVELNYDELPAKELGEFVRLGVEREIMLLKRDADAVRANTLPESESQSKS